MGESMDFFEDLREREAAKAKAPVEACEPEPEPASAPPAPDLEAPLLEDPPPQEEHNQGIQEQETQPPPVLEQAPLPERDPLLYVCRVLSIITVVGALLCLVVNAISLFRSFDFRGFDYRVSVFVGIMRCYTVAIAVLVILAETEWQALFRWWRLLEFWVGRGLLQVLVAVLTRVLKRQSGETSAEGLLHEIASWWLFGCGILYIVAGSTFSCWLNCLFQIMNKRMSCLISFPCTLFSSASVWETCTCVNVGCSCCGSSTSRGMTFVGLLINARNIAGVVVLRTHKAQPFEKAELASPSPEGP